jgi:hypothetical protein
VRAALLRAQLRDRELRGELRTLSAQDDRALIRRPRGQVVRTHRRANVLSLRAVGAKHGMSEGAVRKLSDRRHSSMSAASGALPRTWAFS